MTTLALGVAVIAALLTGAQGVLAVPKAAAADVSSVQALYAADLVSRINAERAARGTFGLDVPQLAVDAGLANYAQAWSAHLAATGTVADPPFPTCNGPASQVCIFAANSGSSGNGYWPGDGSDGMDGEYMASAPHRQNMLGAGYTDVGVGVTCSGGRAFSVEVFGFTIGDIPGALAREAGQNSVQGQPVPASPVVAGAPSGDPVYCPGQTIAANGAVTATGGQLPYPFRVASVVGEANVPAPVVGMASMPGGGGYWLVRSDGSVSTHGAAGNYGSMAGTPLNAPVAHIVATTDGRGYWMVASDGGIFSFGDAGFYGSMGGQHLNAPVVGIAPTPTGHGYWLVASDGGVFAFGAPFDGSTGNLHLNLPVNGMAARSDGQGYWFVASDGGIFAFGRAAFLGSTGGMALNAPVVGMAPDDATGGYWLVAGDGGVFTFGAPFLGAG